MLNLYNPAYLTIKKEIELTDNSGNTGTFKAFTYKNSLRFSILLRKAPGIEMTDRLLNEIKRYRRT